jgi:hypothetical protein
VRHATASKGEQHAEFERREHLAFQRDDAIAIAIAGSLRSGTVFLALS